MHAGIPLPDNAAPSPPDAAAGRLPLFNVVGFTGHRELADAWIALSSIARGGDQLFVAEARAAGMSWHGILPLARAEFERDFAPAEWAAVEATLETADHLRVI